MMKFRVHSVGRVDGDGDPRRHRRRLSSVVDDTGRGGSGTPAFDDTAVSIASEAARNDDSVASLVGGGGGGGHAQVRRQRSRSAEFRFFRLDEGEGGATATVGTTRPPYSRFADISLAPDEVFHGDLLRPSPVGAAEGGSLASLPTLTVAEVGSTLRLHPLELADVGLAAPATEQQQQHSPTSPFTLAAMRKRDRELARYNIHRPTHVFLVVLAVSLGYDTLVGAPVAFFAHGRGTGVLVYAMITVGVVAPLAQVMFCLGRVTRMGPFALFSGGPIGHGVAVAMTGYACVALWIKGPPLVHALNYTFLSIGKEWNLGGSSLATAGRAWLRGIGLVDSCRKREDDCLAAIVDGLPAFQFWTNSVLGAQRYLPSLEICVCAFLSWLFVAGCVTTSSRRGWLTLWATSGFAQLAFLCFVVSGVLASSASSDITDMFSIADFWSAEVWAAATKVAFSQAALLSGPLIFLGSRTHERGFRLSLEVPAAIVFSLLLQVVVYLSFFSAHHDSARIAFVAAEFDLYDFTFGILPDILSEGGNRGGNIFFFLALFLSELTTCSLYVHHLSTALLEGRLLSGEHRLSVCAALLCLIPGLCGSILLVSGWHGRTLHAAVTKYAVVPPMVAIAPTWITLLVVYGPSNLGGSFTSVTHFKAYRLFVNLSLKILAVVSFSFVLLSLVHDPNHIDFPSWAKWIAVGLCVAIVTQMFAYFLYRIARAASKCRPLWPEFRVVLADPSPPPGSPSSASSASGVARRPPSSSRAAFVDDDDQGARGGDAVRPEAVRQVFQMKEKLQPNIKI